MKLVLQRELHGPIDRRSGLREVLNRQPDLAPARWQAGYVDTGKSWRSYADIDPAAFELLEKYRERRASARNNVREQLLLAAWCKHSGLRDQERAHRLAALAVAQPAEQPPILESLGYQQIGSHWLSPEEVLDWQRQSRAAEESLKTWGKPIERLAAQLRGNVRRREAARAGLLEIRDPAAIPALEWNLTDDIEAMHLLVEVLGDMPAHEASLSLAKLGVLAQGPDVRESAVRSLRGRKLEDFVPPLIGLLSEPIHSTLSAEFVRGRLFFTYVAARETADEIQIHKTLFMPGARINIPVRMLGNGTALGSRLATSGDSNLFVADQVFARNQVRDAQNQRIQELNTRVRTVLREVSGRDLGDDPDAMWNWWAEAADIRTGPKRVVVSEDYVQSPPTVVLTRSSSCFQAGTPVWTEAGPMPIEQIRMGDRVLAQNADTGELAYKPVLRKSLGPARQLIRVTAGDETLVCTDGHRFWVAGEAWIKAHELSPKKLLHTATASIPVESVSEGPTDETHNLVVADFHSYFVGKQAFLVQDLPLPRSTNCVVPGLQPEW